MLTEQAIEEADALVARVRPLLAGQSPDVVGAALGELCAIFLASHAPGPRAQQYRLFLGLIHDLTSHFARHMIATGRAPEGWDEEDLHDS
jgi:hypothetical protein